MGKISINGIIGKDVSLLDVVADVMEVTKVGIPETLEVEINSVGGYADEGYNIYSYLQRLPFNVTTIAAGDCMSIATVIFAAGNQRLIAQDANFMIHNAWVSDVVGNADELREVAEMLDEENKRIRKVYQSAFGLSDDALEPLMKKDTYINPEQAVKLGIATGIYTEQTAGPSGLQAVALSKNLNNLIMAKEQNTLMEGFKSVLSDLRSLIKNEATDPQPNNLLVDLADGVKLFVMTEDGEIEGKIAYIADEEGNPSKELAPVGQHNLLDGRVITVGKGGVIESVAEAAAEEVDENEEMLAIKAENEALKAELAEMRAEVTNAMQVMAIMKTNYKPKTKAFAGAKPADSGKAKDSKVNIMETRNEYKEKFSNKKNARVRV
jgi:ATP-dependent protease ClpP protease subunit